MKRSSTLTLTTAVITLSLLAMGLVSACKKDCTKVDDVTVAGNVKAAIAKKMPKLAKDINVEVKDKLVTLTGHVNYEPSQKLAGDTAKSVECVRDVVNKVIVTSPPPGCAAGDHQCCCPDGGCDCVPSTQKCEICSPK